MLTKLKPAAPIHGYATIKLTKGYIAIVDEDDYENLSQYKWLAFKWSNKYYAARKIIKNGKTFWLPMHRQIMHTPKGLIVHHKNYNTMDNRKKNLDNMRKEQHNWLHGYRRH